MSRSPERSEGEGSVSRGSQMLRCAQHDSVWITDIMTLFTLIVSTASKPLRGRLNHYVTMMGNQVMMTVIHT